MSLQTVSSRCSHFTCAELFLNRFANPKGKTMNVSSRTVVILNILSAAGVVLILADKFHWF
ncbi:stress response membrane protein YncL [Enterobacter sp. RHBSTW-00994]|uniref:stress response membrane protein YncL n=1 Tax=Enterobacter sp. RHBSTW-00994 TaxID=2742676 RepID=UPI0031F81773